VAQEVEGSENPATGPFLYRTSIAESTTVYHVNSPARRNSLEIFAQILTDPLWLAGIAVFNAEIG
jgi:hypothetical protein